VRTVSPPSPREGLARPQRRIVYLAPVDIQVARVDRQAIVYFCSALARVGILVRLAALRVRLSQAERHRPDDPLDLYGVDARFPVDLIPTALRQDSGRWLVGVTRLVAYVRYARRVLRDSPRDDGLVFYLKNYAPALALFLLRRRPSIVFEAHAMPRGWMQRLVLGHVQGVIANSYALAHDLRVAQPSLNVLATHQGVDLRPYRQLANADKVELRRHLGLPVGGRLVVYTGKITIGSCEVDYILRAAGTLRDVTFALVGGREDHVEHWRNEARRRGLANSVFTGFVPPREVHQYHLAADVLVLYYPSDVHPYLSPGKLFGYMAADVPIVAVDLPVLREVLGNPPSATMVPPDDPDELAAAIRGVLDDPRQPAVRASTARQRVESFTWDARARQIAQFIDDLPAFQRPSTLDHSTPAANGR
jgi:glycosyltransferase involved in cell wall biosynthesis